MRFFAPASSLTMRFTSSSIDAEAFEASLCVYRKSFMELTGYGEPVFWKPRSISHIGPTWKMSSERSFHRYVLQKESTLPLSSHNMKYLRKLSRSRYLRYPFTGSVKFDANTDASNLLKNLCMYCDCAATISSSLGDFIVTGIPLSDVNHDTSWLAYASISMKYPPVRASPLVSVGSISVSSTRPGFTSTWSHSWYAPSYSPLYMTSTNVQYGVNGIPASRLIS